MPVPSQILSDAKAKIINQNVLALSEKRPGIDLPGTLNAYASAIERELGRARSDLDQAKLEMDRTRMVQDLDYAKVIHVDWDDSLCQRVQLAGAVTNFKLVFDKNADDSERAAPGRWHTLIFVAQGRRSAPTIGWPREPAILWLDGREYQGSSQLCADEVGIDVVELLWDGDRYLARHGSYESKKRPTWSPPSSSKPSKQAAPKR